MRKLLAAVLGTVVVVPAAACSSTTASSSTTTTGSHATKASVGDVAGKTPDEILTAAMAAANKAGTAHYNLTAAQGTQTQTVTGDASQTEGQQSILLGSQQITVILVNNVAYVQGNAGGLQSAMGFSASAASRYAGKWIAVHPSDSVYKSIEQAVTLKGTLQQLGPSAPLTLTDPTSANGHQVIGVKGNLPNAATSGVTGTSTLYVSTTEPILPQTLSATASNGTQHVTDTGTFSRWGQPLHLAAPTASVPLSTISTQ
jgi:hypothetical protein